LQRNPWVEVNLRGAFAVTYIEVDNRPDGNCLDRLGNFRVYADGRLLGQFNHTQMQGRPPKIVIPVRRVIHSVRVQLEGHNYLHLGAVRAFGPHNYSELGAQMVDVAHAKQVSMSSQYENFVAERLVDGNPGSFMHTNNEVGKKEKKQEKKT